MKRRLFYFSQFLCSILLCLFFSATIEVKAQESKIDQNETYTLTTEIEDEDVPLVATEVPSNNTVKVCMIVILGLQIVALVACGIIACVKQHRERENE